MRRALALLASCLCIAAPSLAQDRTMLPLVAVLRVNTADTVEPGQTLFRNALAAVGRVDGKNIRLESRFAEGRPDRLPDLARSLVADRPAVMVAFGEAAVRAAQQATSTIPILTIADDLVESKLIASLAKPGGNTTGVSILATELDAKKIDVLKQMLPSARLFGVLRDPSTSVPARMQAIGETAQALGIALKIMDVHSPADIAPAFASFSDADAVDILASPLLFSLRKQLGELSLERKLPTICQFREAVEAGCLASYGISLSRAFVALADLTDKVLKGAQPSDTPAEQPTTFELVINLKTAKALGLTIPQSMLQLADEVIE
jgi:putative tryptophan/tyrosine transport system substrate-binding protein